MCHYWLTKGLYTVPLTIYLQAFNNEKEGYSMTLFEQHSCGWQSLWSLGGNHQSCGAPERSCGAVESRKDIQLSTPRGCERTSANPDFCDYCCDYRLWLLLLILSVGKVIHSLLSECQQRVYTWKYIITLLNTHFFPCDQVCCILHGQSCSHRMIDTRTPRLHPYKLSQSLPAQSCHQPTLVFHPHSHLVLYNRRIDFKVTL